MIFDSTKHVEISFAEAVARMKSGGNVFAGNGFEYRMSGRTLLSKNAGVDCGFAESGLNVSVALQMGWYIKKPFDVRQAMRDKPDEWVGAFELRGQWHKVGFDTKNFMAVETRLFNSDIPTSFELAEVDYLISSELDACIPLDEVPADAR